VVVLTVGGGVGLSQRPLIKISPEAHPHLPERSNTWPGGQDGLGVVLGAGGGVGFVHFPPINTNPTAQPHLPETSTTNPGGQVTGGR